MENTARSKNTMNNFGYHSIDELLEQGVTMDFRKFKKNWGIWMPDQLLVSISTTHPSKDAENVTIAHEWLHAYEDLILYPHPNFDVTLASRSPDIVIDEYAKWHVKNDPELVEYIRSYFKNEGF